MVGRNLAFRTNHFKTSKNALATLSGVLFCELHVIFTLVGELKPGPADYKA